MIARVAVFAPLERTFDYRVPAALSVVVGTRVWAPLSGRKLEGVVVALDPPDARGPLKELGRVVEAPGVSAELLELARWIADYYCAPLGEALRLMLPAGGQARARKKVTLTDEGERLAAGVGAALEPVGLGALAADERAYLAALAAKTKTTPRPRVLDSLAARGLIAVDEKVATRRRRLSAITDGDPWASAKTEAAPALTPAQARALAAIEDALRRGEYAPFLLHGVTGSGKTEVYLRAIATALSGGKTALVLVPEISLTPQLAARFAGRFGTRVAVLHSGLTEAARAEAWRRIEGGEATIALGARSAVFAPLPRLGVVVVDEEHDASFKQEEGVRYNGRDAALVRARAARAVAVLGSATPALETYLAAKEGRLRLLEMPERATARPLPAVEIVDLRQHRGVVTDVLYRALADTVGRGEQAILFLNRRGFSTFSLCKRCGEPVRCRHCSVSLTYHRDSDRLLCHYCGFSAETERRCAHCGAQAVERLGYGTEQLEAMLTEALPAARVARLDRDSAAGDGLVRVLDAFRQREIDVLVGTQMVTKGHDFPGVTLVGVVLADQGLNLPDFRASERTFQLLTQVAGRAGRGERAGRVILQTFQPRAEAIACARDHDYRRFVELELAARVEPRYPPRTRMACVRLDGADPLLVREAAARAAAAGRRLAERAPRETRVAVLGPTEAPLSRLKGKTRWQLFVQAERAVEVRALARAASADGTMPGVRVSIDVDPISML